MRVMISQPRYLPAINYLQRLHHSDLLVLLDDVQRQARGWENRNKLLLGGKPVWLTIPVASGTREWISRARIDSAEWLNDHIERIKGSYGHHSYFDLGILDRYYAGILDLINADGPNYAVILSHFVVNVMSIFGIETPTLLSSSLGVHDITGPDKLVAIARKVGASEYISGPNGRAYGVLDAFRGSGIDVSFHDFKFPIYDQRGVEEFIPWLGFFDTFFNAGPEYTVDVINADLVLQKE